MAAKAVSKSGSEVEMVSGAKTKACPQGRSWLSSAKETVYKTNEVNKTAVVLCPVEGAFDTTEIFGDGYCGWYAVLAAMQKIRESGLYGPYLQKVYNKTPGIEQVLKESNCEIQSGSTKCDLQVAKSFLALIREINGVKSDDEYMQDQDIETLAQRLNITIALTGPKISEAEWRYISPISDFTKVLGIVSVGNLPPTAMLPPPIILKHKSGAKQADHWDLMSAKKGVFAFQSVDRASLEKTGSAEASPEKVESASESAPEAVLDKPADTSSTALEPPTASDVENDPVPKSDVASTDATTGQEEGEDEDAATVLSDGDGDEEGAEAGGPAEEDLQDESDEEESGKEVSSQSSPDPTAPEATALPQSQPTQAVATKVESPTGEVKTTTATKNTANGMEVTIRVLIPPGAEHTVTGDAGDSADTALKAMARSINQSGGKKTRGRGKPKGKRTRRA